MSNRWIYDNTKWIIQSRFNAPIIMCSFVCKCHNTQTWSGRCGVGHVRITLLKCLPSEMRDDNKVFSHFSSIHIAFVCVCVSNIINSSARSSSISISDVETRIGSFVCLRKFKRKTSQCLFRRISYILYILHTLNYIFSFHTFFYS